MPKDLTFLGTRELGAAWQSTIEGRLYTAVGAVEALSGGDIMTEGLGRLAGDGTGSEQFLSKEVTLADAIGSLELFQNLCFDSIFTSSLCQNKWFIQRLS